jgi:integrase
MAHIHKSRRHGDGGIDQRGDRFRLRWRIGNRRHSKTIIGTAREARAELRRILGDADRGLRVVPGKLTLGVYIEEWLAGDTALAAKTKERYLQLARQQILPHLGACSLQDLRPAQVAEWHTLLLKSGGAGGKPLGARTVGHCHRLLHKALERAVSLELVARNVVHTVRPPKVDTKEIEILDRARIDAILAALEGKELHSIVSLALATGLRRGELCGLAWGAVDLDKAELRVERSLEQTQAGLRFKGPKTRSGRRTISLAASTVELIRAHRRQQAEQRLKLGMGRITDEDLVFARADGSPYPPNNLSRDWSRLRTGVAFHSLRHWHASALIASGLDVVAVSKRLGHSSPALTLSVYSHLFQGNDRRAAEAIEKALGSSLGPKFT